MVGIVVPQGRLQRTQRRLLVNNVKFSGWLPGKQVSLDDISPQPLLLEFCIECLDCTWCEIDSGDGIALFTKCHDLVTATTGRHQYPGWGRAHRGKPVTERWTGLPPVPSGFPALVAIFPNILLIWLGERDSHNSVIKKQTVH